MLRTVNKTIGNLRLTIYTFEVAGDTLPIHSHTESTNHITIISAGSFKCVGDAEIEGKTLNAGEVIDWEPYKEHGFIALSNNSKMIQIAK